MSKSTKDVKNTTPAGVAASAPPLPHTVIVVLCLATFVKLVLAYNTQGTNDVLFFQAYLAKIRLQGGIPLYQNGVFLTRDGMAYHAEGFQHPPFVIHLLGLLGLVQDVFHIGFPFLFRSLSIIADFISILLMWQLLRHRPRDNTILLCLLAASPVSILISGFHGNTDPLVVLCVIAAVYCCYRRRTPWLIGLALGMAMNIKLWPVVLVPAVFWWLTRDERIPFLLSMITTCLIGSLPYIVMDPTLVAGKVLGYASLYGQWGISRLIPLTQFDSLNSAFAFAGRYCLIAFTTWCAYRMNQREQKPHLFTQFGLIMSIFLAITPGFGIQYLTWLNPWLVQLGAPVMILFHVTAGIFLTLVYTFWCGGFPWVLADSTRMGTWKGFIIWHELVCWASICFIAYLFLKRTGLLPHREKPAQLAAKVTAKGKDGGISEKRKKEKLAGKGVRTRL